MVTARDQRREPQQRPQPRGFVVHFQRLQEAHHRGDRRAVHHPLGERVQASADLQVAERGGAQDRSDQRPRHGAAAVHQLGGRPGGEPNRFQCRVFQQLAQRRPAHPFGGRGNQCRADNPAAVLLRKLPGMRQHRHAAHRMADQHDHPARRYGLQHGLQVLAQLGERVGLGVGLAGLSMPALVVEGHLHVSSPVLGKAPTLKVKGAHAQTESMDEDDGQRSVFRADPRALPAAPRRASSPHSCAQRPRRRNLHPRKDLRGWWRVRPSTGEPMRRRWWRPRSARHLPQATPCACGFLRQSTVFGLAVGSVMRPRGLVTTS